MKGYKYYKTIEYNNFYEMLHALYEKHSTKIANKYAKKTEATEITYHQLIKEISSLKSIVKRTLLTKTFFKRPIDACFYFGVNCFYRHQIKKGIVPNIV